MPFDLLLNSHKQMNLTVLMASIVGFLRILIRWILYDKSQMIEQLEWLRDTLAAAALNCEKVHILGHIPPNLSNALEVWNREYLKLIRQYADVISGQFYGHTHTDGFKLTYSKDKVPAPLSVAWIGGSGTPYIGINPNYRLYTVEPKTFEVVDHETYIFNLAEANMTPNQPPRWFKEYSFRDTFKVPDLSPFTLSKLVTKTFRRDRKLLSKVNIE